MRPYIICHMLSSIDGKIDGTSLKGLTAAGEYEATGGQLKGDAWICGRTTMQQHFADTEPFTVASFLAAGPQSVHIAQQARSYAVAVDTLGKLRWSSAAIDGDHLISMLSERVPVEYLAMLRATGISYIVVGQDGRRSGAGRALCWRSNSEFAPCCSKAAVTSTGRSSRLASSMNSAC